MRSVLTLVLILLFASPAMSDATDERPRAHDLGLIVGILPTGPLNAITDVNDVRVGHSTVIEGDSVRTGVTAILPHGGNIYRERVPAAIYVGNGFGKLLGITQVRELGELETPHSLDLHLVCLESRRRHGRHAAGTSRHARRSFDQCGRG